MLDLSRMVSGVFSFGGAWLTGVNSVLGRFTVFLSEALTVRFLRPVAPATLRRGDELWTRQARWRGLPCA